MTKIFVPVFAAALLTIGTLNAQTPKGKPAPAVKKETAPVNRVPVPVARPVVPVTKPTPSVVKPAVPVAVKPAAAPVPPPKPAPVPKPMPAPAPAPKPVAVKPVAPVAPAKAPAAVAKAPVAKKAVAKKAASKKPKASPVIVEEMEPKARTTPRRYEEDETPVRRVEERKIVVREMESDDENETVSCCKQKAKSCRENYGYKKECHEECWHYGRYSKRRYDKYNYLMNYYKEKNEQYRKAHQEGNSHH
jgi:hypothetical protein